MLRVYGITYDHTVNYGSALQAYALGAVIESLRPCGENCTYRLIPVRTFPEWKSRMWKSRILKPLISYARRSFSPFEKANIRFAEVHSMKDLPSLNDFADAFVCGSDVIWSSVHNKSSNVFALDFAEKYKFSYAASFGKSKPTERYLKTLKPAVAALNEVSVRESSGCEIVKSAIGREAEVVLDPVFLISTEQWTELAAPPAKKKNPYIFVYVTHHRAITGALIDAIRKQTGMRVVFATYAKPSLMLREHKLRIQTTELWLRQLIDADVVITNSFHCTAFSVLFHKTFFTAVSGEKDAGINVRMHDLLTAMGLSDRLINSVPEMVDLTAPSFARADEIIAAKRKSSVAFLRRNLEAAYREKTGSQP